MSKGKKFRVKRLRRLANARLRTGKPIVKHQLVSGRTGAVHTKKLRSRETP
jgi:hypothetical protein